MENVLINQRISHTFLEGPPGFYNAPLRAIDFSLSTCRSNPPESRCDPPHHAPMSDGHVSWALIFWGLIGLGIAFGITFAYFVSVRDNAYNTKVRSYLDVRDASFKKGILAGRRWLAAFIAEAEQARDRRDDYLVQKSHPARKSAEVVKEVKQEKRSLVEQVKFLEYQLKAYEEYFPQLEEYRELILDERVPLSAGSENLEELESADPSQLFLSREEWERLSIAERNQLALDRYRASRL